jgi:hypothetical protein
MLLLGEKRRTVAQSPDYNNHGGERATPAKLTATPFRHRTIVQKRTSGSYAGQLFVAVRQHLSSESVV